MERGKGDGVFGTLIADMEHDQPAAVHTGSVCWNTPTAISWGLRQYQRPQARRVE
jgi:hypothetical protein